MAWINLLAMIITITIGSTLYIKSVCPAQLENRIGHKAYFRCIRYRQVSAYFLSIGFVCYFLYTLYPLPLPIPHELPWPRYFSVLLSLFILIPGVRIFIKSRKSVGLESMRPHKKHPLMKKGLYAKIRHPQAIGEFSMWFSWSLILNTPFLIIISLLWIPIFYLKCKAEEKDLIIRFGQEYIEYRNQTGFFIPKGFFKKKSDKWPPY